MKFFPAPLALLLACAPVMGAAAETCSSSTLASPAYAFARWCGDPATTGTLRVGRRDGPAMEFLQVPVDTYRELIRTHLVAKYLSTEVEPRFQRAAVADRPRADAPRPAAVAPAPQPTAAPAPRRTPRRPAERRA
jgi:hypothetical protein